MQTYQQVWVSIFFFFLTLLPGHGVAGAECNSDQKAEDSLYNHTWSERGIFVFGSMSFDFHKEIAVVPPKDPGPPRVHPLRNCSTSDFYCAEAGAIQIVLPRTCRGVAVGDVWGVGGISMDVISSRDVLEPHRSVGREYYLGVVGRDDIVFAYMPKRGVEAVYRDFDMPATRNLRALAETPAGLLALAREDSRYRSWRVTFDPFGPCA